MLDLKQLREDPDRRREALARRGDAERLDPVLELDARRRALLPELEELRASRNAASKRIGELQRAGEDASEAIAAVRATGDREKELEASLREVSAELDAALALVPNLPSPDAPPEDTVLREVGEAGATRPRSPGAARRAGRPRGRRARGGLALRLPEGLAGVPGAGAGALGDGRALRAGVHAGGAAGAGARGGPVRHGLPARHRAADLPRARRRPVPGGHLGGAAGLAARRRDRRRGRAAAALRGLLPLLSPRGGRRGQGHARDLPRAPVRQGGDVRVRAPRRTRPRSTSGCWRSRRRCCRRSTSPTGW